MAAKSTENAHVEAETTVADEVKIPHQKDVPALEVDETEFTFVERVKGVVRNKKFLAGVSSVALIAAGVFVVRKRNENVSEDEVVTD